MKRSSVGLLILCLSFFTAAPVFAGVTCSLTCPANITQANDANQCGAIVNYPPATATNCGQTHPNPPPGSFFPVGTTTVTVDTDATTSCTFTITINDTQPPTITCPSDIDLFTPGPTTVDFTTQGSDNCPNFTNICTPASGSTFPIGSTLDTCTNKDTSDNTATCTFDVTLTIPADLAITKNDTPDPVEAGENLTYTIDVINNGPATANLVTLQDSIPANTTLASLTTPPGWSSSTPAVGATGLISASKPSMANGETATFTLVVTVDAGTPDGTVITNTADITEEGPGDDDITNNTSTTTTGVGLPEIIIDDVTVTEGDSGTVDACFTLSLSKPSTQNVTVQAATADGTTLSDGDYLSDSGGVNFPAGETQETVCVTVNSDLLDESDETFFVNLSNPVNALIGDDQGLGTIVDDDEPIAPTPPNNVNNDSIEGAGCLLAKGMDGRMAFPFVSLLLAVGILAARRINARLEK